VPVPAADLWAVQFWRIPTNSLSSSGPTSATPQRYGATFGAINSATDPAIGADTSGNARLVFSVVDPHTYYGIRWANWPAGGSPSALSALAGTEALLDEAGRAIRTGDYCHAGWDGSNFWWFCGAATAPNNAWQEYYSTN